MGRRKNRKIERRRQQSHDGWERWAPREPVAVDPEALAFGRNDDYLDGFSLFERTLQMAVAQKTCSGCREFIEDGEGGRGSCLHPGSGILAPWTDTTACDFFAARRR
jgi:hypothetical protein